MYVNSSFKVIFAATYLRLCWSCENVFVTQYDRLEYFNVITQP